MTTYGSRLRRQAAITGNDLRLLLADRATIVLLLATPIIIMILFGPAAKVMLQRQGFKHANGSEQVVPGQAAMFSLILVGTAAYSVFREYTWKTWNRIRGHGVGPSELITAKAVIPICVAVLQMAVLFAVGAAFLGLRIQGSTAGLLVVVIANSFCVVSIGIVLGAMSRTLQQSASIAYLCPLVLGGLGGAFIPVPFLPGWCQAVAPLSPTYWTMRGFNRMVLEPGGLSEAILPALILFGISGMMFSIAIVVTNRSTITRTL